MNDSTDEHVVMLDIASIKVVNPRVRNKRIHDEITENISIVGLKRPITVRKLEFDDEGYSYALICGQGRLESLVQLGQHKIPAIIKSVDEQVGHIMSLVENIARRKPRSTELLERIRDLKSGGVPDVEIATRLGYSTQWVNNVTMLLEKGEKKLLSAYEAGNIPLDIAVLIARSNDEDVQTALMQAYNAKTLNRKQLTIVRNIMARRSEGNKGSSNLVYVKHKQQQKLTAEELSEIYQNSVNEHRIIQNKAEYAKESLLLTKEIFNQLLQNKEFILLLSNENLNNIPVKIIGDAIPHRGEL